MEVIAPKKTGEKCPECGHDLVERKGRYGTFVACENYPECKYVKKDPVEIEYTGEECPKCGSKMIFKMVVLDVLKHVQIILSVSILKTARKKNLL